MKRIHASVTTATTTFGGLFGGFGNSASAAHVHDSAMGIEIVQPSGPILVPAGGKIRSTVRVHGFQQRLSSR